MMFSSSFGKFHVLHQAFGCTASFQYVKVDYGYPQYVLTLVLPNRLTLYFSEVAYAVIVVETQGCYTGMKGSMIFEDDPFAQDFNMDEVDLSFENYEELFSGSLDNPNQLFENEDINGLFGTKDMSVSGSSCQDADAIEVVRTINLHCVYIVYPA